MCLGKKKLLDDVFKKKLLIRDLKFFSSGIAFYVQNFKKREGLELFLERQLWCVVGASDHVSVLII